MSTLFVDELADPQLEALHELLLPVEQPEYWGGHVPHPGPQHAFLSPIVNDTEEVLYGGAAGGGKSDGLLLGALQYVDVPGYHAILLRRTFPMLNQAGGLIQRAHEWLDPSPARWNGNDNRWTFPSGATLEFGNLQYDDTVQKYQGSDFQYVGFDELTQFTLYQFLYMNSRLRKPSAGPLSQVPLRIRGGSNPGGPGNEWVKRYFILKLPPDEEDEQNPEKMAQARSRIFIPAKVWDNPSLDIPATVAGLERLDAMTRRQLLDGDWDAREPGDWIISDTTWIDAAVDLARNIQHRGVPEPIHLKDFGRGISLGIDWGEFTQAYVVWPMEGGGVYIPWSEVKREHDEPGDVAMEIIGVALECGQPLTDVRYDSAGVQSQRTFNKTARAQPGLAKLPSTKISFSKYKKETIGYLRRLFERTAQGRTTQVIAIDPRNRELIRQLKRWPRKSEESDEVDKTVGDDHGPDALVAGVAPIAERYRVAPELKKKKEEQ